MSDRLTPDELKRLQRYVPPSWQEGREWPVAADELASAVSRLQALLSTVATYLPRAILISDREERVGWGKAGFGTVLFADVSGFTALMERFSRDLGREGAEEITLIVNHLFEAVNSIAVRYGGDLLKFAGDAALSFYRGDEHAARACRAAWEMQQAMEEQFACVKTSLGEFPLRMSIGIGSGDILLASLGTPDNAEYAVMGPALAAMGRSEQLAQAGQVFIDLKTRDLAGDTLVITSGEEESFFRLLEAKPRPSAVEYPDLHLSPPADSPYAQLRWLLARLDRLVSYLPPELLERLVLSPDGVGVESDHRWVTTVFADLRGVNALAQAVDPTRRGWFAEAVNCYFLTMRKVVERYKGVLHKVGAGPTGPHLFITFGAPKSRPDDPERAVCTAIEMQEALTAVNREIETLISDVPDLGRPFLRQAIGITTGFVFAGSIGSSRRWEYTVMGDVVNLACRLMAAAADGEVLIADSTAHHLGRGFDLRERPPIDVKGKQHSVSPVQVIGLTALPPLLEAAEGTVVGRQAELAAAQNLLERALQGQGSVLVIHSEAGIGKSRLAQEIAQQAHRCNMCVLAGASLSYGGDIPYLPWADVLRSLLGISAAEREGQLQQLARGLAAADLVSWRPLVADLLDLEVEETELTSSLDPRLRQQRLFDIVLQLIQHEAQAQPLLLVIEDVHWSDPTSLALLDYVARNVADCPAVLLILHRPQERLEDRWRAFEHTVEIVLRELPETATQRLVANLLGVKEAPEQLVDVVLRKAQGNPFFTEEVVRAFVDAEVLRQDDGRWELVADPDYASVPDTVHGVIQTRIDRLQGTDRRVLQVASVIGRVFSSSVLGGVYPYDDLDGTLPRRLSRLGALGLVLLERPEPESVYMFRHALTQDVAYESLPYARRRQLHRRVGMFMETQGREAMSERPGFLAHHFFQGRAWRQALTYSLAAGRKAQREYANEAAVAHFERALQAAAELDDICEEEQLEAHERVGEVMTILGRYDEALEHLEEARALVESQVASAERGRRLADLRCKEASALKAKGDYRDAFGHLERGLKQLGVKESAEGAQLYLMGAGIYYQQGKNDKAMEWCQAGLEVAGQLKERGRETLARGSYLLGAILMRYGDLDGALEHCRRSLATYKELGDLLGQFQAYNNLAMAYYYQDDWSDAVEHFRAAMRLAKEIGYAEGQARVASNLGEVYLVQGQLEAAKEQYRMALGIVQRLGMSYGIALLHNNLGAAYARGGEWKEAVEHLAQSLDLFEEIGSEEFLAELFRHRAEVALGQGRLDGALADAKRSLSYAWTHDMRLEEGMTWRMLGRVYRARDELIQAEKALARSLEIAQEAEKRHEVAMTHLELARLRLQQDRAGEGRALAQQAGRAFRELGARLDLERAEQLLTVGGELSAGEERKGGSR